MTKRLSNGEFLAVIANTPLVSIDLILRNHSGAILMGRRLNEPANGMWFVPGGRIYKNETLEVAFERICTDELGIHRSLSTARLLGAFTHKYETNVFGAPGITTHYVVLAYDLGIQEQMPEAAAQHSATRWVTKEEAHDRKTSGVHSNVLPYFTSGKSA